MSFPGRTLIPFFLILAACAAIRAESAEEGTLAWWAPGGRPAQARLEERLDRCVGTGELAAWHDMLASEPHVAGSAGDRRVIRAIAAAFRRMGLDTEVQEIQVYLPRPVDAEVRILAPEPMSLPIREDPTSADPWTAADDLPIGWNAYSGSGVAEGEVVYVNYGRKEDFEELADHGVSLRGKIALARYGGNFRGYKARFAERAGAAGLLIYTDPADSGWGRGLSWPEGGWADATYIQRGSILTLPWRGDPLTPFEPAIEGTRRLAPEDVDLPTIPVQPIGWGAAREILSRMQGDSVPEGWQGGLPFRYRLTGGEVLRVRLRVEQERRIVSTANVTGTLPGRDHSGEMVLFGAHHDAWGFGAGDPTAGTILVLESARCFANAARKGLRPRRDLVFAAWGAEEHGIVGSVEWIEAHREPLSRGAVAYLNADMAAMGPDFGSAADPFLKPVLAAAAALVPHPDPTRGTVLEDWIARNPDPEDPARPRFGDLGGGSDHVGFTTHLVVPSASVSAGGSDGVAYHSLRDHLAWYRRVVGDDYRPAAMLTRVANRTLARLAGADLPPLDPTRLATDFRRHLGSLARRAEELGISFDPTRLEAASRMLEPLAADVLDLLWESLETGTLGEEDREAASRILIRMPRAWKHAEGLEGRAWHRSLWAAPDETSGYAPWMLPALRKAVEDRDEAALRRAEELYVEAFRLQEKQLMELRELLGP